MEIRLADGDTPFYEGVYVDVDGLVVFVCPKWAHIAADRTPLICHGEGAEVDQLMREIAAGAEDCGSVLFTRDPRFLLIGLRYLLFESSGRRGDDMKNFQGDVKKAGTQYPILRRKSDSEIRKWL